MDNLSLDTGINVSDEQETIATDGIISDDVDTDETETTDDEVYEGDTDVDSTTDDTESVQSDETESKPKVNKVAKILAQKNAFKKEAEELKEKVALLELKGKYGQFDEQAVLQIRKDNPTLPYDDAVVLWKAKQPRSESKRTSGIIGKEARIGSDTVNDTMLSKLSHEEYSKTMDMISSGKLRYVKG